VEFPIAHFFNVATTSNTGGRAWQEFTGSRAKSNVNNIGIGEEKLKSSDDDVGGSGGVGSSSSSASSSTSSTSRGSSSSSSSSSSTDKGGNNAAASGNINKSSANSNKGNTIPIGMSSQDEIDEHVRIAQIRKAAKRKHVIMNVTQDFQNTLLFVMKQNCVVGPGQFLEIFADEYGRENAHDMAVVANMVRIIWKIQCA
jgi:hypothetical protein